MKRRNRAPRRSVRRVDLLLVGVAVVTLAGAGVAVLGSSTSSQAAPTHDAMLDVPTSSGVAAPVHWPAAVFLGDSWTAGNEMGGRGTANWSSVLSTSLQWYPTNLAYGGTSYQLGAPDHQFASPDHLRSLAEARPDVVVVANGVNDVGKVPVPEWSRNAGATFDAIAAAAPQARLVVIGVIAPGPAAGIPGYAAWNDALQTVVREHGGVFVDAYGEDWFGGSAASYIGSDRFHPTDAGQKYLAGRVQDDLERDGVVAALDTVRT